MGEQHILNEISNTRKMSKYHCLLKKKQNKTKHQTTSLQGTQLYIRTYIQD